MNNKFDFDKEINRRNTGSLKWDVPENELPLWVADMDFETGTGRQKSTSEESRAWCVWVFRSAGLLVSGLSGLVEETPSSGH